MHSASRWIAALAVFAAPAPRATAVVPSPTNPAQHPDGPPVPAALALHGPLALADELLFEEPGDGSIWVLGGTRYKARFALEGLAYYPWLGADAPSSEPLQFALRSAHLGGELLELERVAPVRHGELVTYDRGALLESYELEPGSIEQVFRLERLPRAGELVLRIAAGGFAGVETPAGLRFESERGGASYSRAVVFDARGRHGEVETRWDDGEIEIRVAEDFLAAAELPITIDPVIETIAVTNDSELTYANSDVAYDASTDRFAVVYERVFNSAESDVFSMLFTADGAEVAGSLVAVDITTAAWMQPQIANHHAAAQFLVVANTSPTGGATTLIEGRTRQAASNVQGAKFTISDTESDIRTRPDVGGNAGSLFGTHYCVVWTVASKGADNVYYQLVSTGGLLLFPDSQELAVGFPEDRLATISKSCGREPFASQEWNVVWQHGDFSGAYDIWGAQIHWDGTLTTPPFAIDDSAELDRHPQASSLLDGGTGPRPYLVTYERGTAPDQDVWGTVLAGSEVVAPPANLMLVEGGAYLDQNQNRAVVDSDGSSFTVAYREHFFGDLSTYSVYLSTFRLGGGALVPVEVHEPAGLSFEDQDLPALTAMHGPVGWVPTTPGRAMVTWQEERPLDDTWAIEGALFESDFEAGVALCFGDGAACPCGNSTAAQEGCANSTGAGCRLSGLGSGRVELDDLQLVVEHGVPGQPGILFQGDVTLEGGAGASFGDGLRCCGVNVLRLEVLLAGPGGVAASSVGIVAEGGVSAGDTRCYQYLYRDPVGSACGASFNLSNGYEVLWAQ